MDPRPRTAPDTSPEPTASPRASPPASPRARRGRYISDSIIERRRRMLEVAKTMIAEGGREGFTIRELGRRANVSVTTIYATYGDKEGLIAAAIQDYYDGLSVVARARRATSLPALLMSADLAREAVLANKPYARHYVELYFSATLDPRIYKAIQETTTPAAGQFPWLQKAQRDGDILPGMALEEIITLVANHRLVVLHDWASGRIKDEDLGTATKIAFLVIARGVTRGPTQARVEAELKKLLRASAADPPK